MYITRLPSGLWRVAVKHHGRRRTATATTRAEVVGRGAELLLELGGQPKQSPTVGELLDTHLAAVELSPTTRADYLSVRRRLPDSFCDRTVSDVTPRIIEDLYRQLAAVMSPHRIRRVHELLSVAWRRAVRYTWATNNPVTHAEPPKRDSHEIVPPTPDEVAALIAAAPDDFADYIRVAASTGARRSELVALQWADIDLERSQIKIRHSRVYTKASGVVDRETKTGRKGHRVIAVGVPVATALRRRRAHQVAKALGAGFPAPVWMFSATAGATPWGPTYPTLAFGRARARAGLTRVRLHDLRHFVATQMLASGHSVAQVAARLGQTQQATTARYSHWIPAADRDAANTLEALIEA